MATILNSILLVDDNSFDLEIVTMILKRSKILNETGLIHLADSGQSALEFLTLFRNDPTKFPQLILLDINMPKMNGFEFLEQFQPKIDEKIFPPTHVVMLTSSMSNSDSEKACQYACVKLFLTKPITKKIIQTKISNLFEQE